MNKFSQILRSLVVAFVLVGSISACTEKEQVNPKKSEKLPNAPVMDEPGHVRPG